MQTVAAGGSADNTAFQPGRSIPIVFNDGDDAASEHKSVSDGEDNQIDELEPAFVSKIAPIAGYRRSRIAPRANDTDPAIRWRRQLLFDAAAAASPPAARFELSTLVINPSDVTQNFDASIEWASILARGLPDVDVRHEVVQPSDPAPHHSHLPITNKDRLTVVVPPPTESARAAALNITRVALSTLPTWTHPIFGTASGGGTVSVSSFNPVQSVVLPTAWGSDRNFLLCAPTGAGKTNVALLAIARHFARYIGRDGVLPSGAAAARARRQVVYVAPLKALVAEVVSNLTGRLRPIGATVLELTGDTAVTHSDVGAADVVVCTPEKLDIVTRGRSAAVRVGTLILDEVHLLHDTRGAVLEALVARFTTQTVRAPAFEEAIMVAASAAGSGSGATAGAAGAGTAAGRALGGVGDAAAVSAFLAAADAAALASGGGMGAVRLVGLSATCPNAADVGSFLQCQPRDVFVFGPAYRPVPLEQVFIGVADKSSKKRGAIIDETCLEIALTRARVCQVIIFTHGRGDTVKTARALIEAVVSTGQIAALLPTNSASVAASLQAAEKALPQGSPLKALIPYGVGVHHAGLTAHERTTAEDLFRDGAIRVLVSTATLAWGVNLPAHTVVIKGTDVYSPEKGGFVNLGVMDILQMFGRAGRPQFDDSGEGILITSQALLPHYIRVCNTLINVESRLLETLPERLGAEIHSGAVGSVRDAVALLRRTFLAVRARRAPGMYGVTATGAPLAVTSSAYGGSLGAPTATVTEADLDEYLTVVAHSAVDSLVAAGLVRRDAADGTVATSLGSLAASFYLSCKTTYAFVNNLRESSGDVEVLRTFAAAAEFSSLSVRKDEVVEVERLSHLVPIPIRDAPTTAAAKAAVLLQCVISRIPLTGLTLAADALYIAGAAGRLLRALAEIALRCGFARAYASSMLLARAAETRSWPTECPLRLFPRLGAVADTLERRCSSINASWVQADGSDGAQFGAGGLQWSQFHYLNADDVAGVVGSARVAPQIVKAFARLPRVFAKATIRAVAATIIELSVFIHGVFDWDVEVHTRSLPLTVTVTDSSGLAIGAWTRALLEPRSVRAAVSTRAAAAAAEVAAAGGSADAAAAAAAAITTKASDGDDDDDCEPLEVTFTLRIPAGRPPSTLMVAVTHERFFGCDTTTSVVARTLLVPPPVAVPTDLPAVSSAVRGGSGAAPGCAAMRDGDDNGDDESEDGDDLDGADEDFGDGPAPTATSLTTPAAPIDSPTTFLFPLPSPLLRRASRLHSHIVAATAPVLTCLHPTWPKGPLVGPADPAAATAAAAIAVALAAASPRVRRLTPLQYRAAAQLIGMATSTVVSAPGGSGRTVGILMPLVRFLLIRDGASAAADATDTDSDRLRPAAASVGDAASLAEANAALAVRRQSLKQRALVIVVDAAVPYMTALLTRALTAAVPSVSVGRLRDDVAYDIATLVASDVVVASPAAAATITRMWRSGSVAAAAAAASVGAAVRSIGLVVVDDADVLTPPLEEAVSRLRLVSATLASGDGEEDEESDDGGDDDADMAGTTSGTHPPIRFVSFMDTALSAGDYAAWTGAGNAAAINAVTSGVAAPHATTIGFTATTTTAGPAMATVPLPTPSISTLPSSLLLLGPSAGTPTPTLRILPVDVPNPRGPSDDLVYIRAARAVATALDAAAAAAVASIAEQVVTAAADDPTTAAAAAAAASSALNALIAGSGAGAVGTTQPSAIMSARDVDVVAEIAALEAEEVSTLQPPRALVFAPTVSAAVALACVLATITQGAPAGAPTATTTSTTTTTATGDDSLILSRFAATGAPLPPSTLTGLSPLTSAIAERGVALLLPHAAQHEQTAVLALWTSRAVQVLVAPLSCAYSLPPSARADVVVVVSPAAAAAAHPSVGDEWCDVRKALARATRPGPASSATGAAGDPLGDADAGGGSGGGGGAVGDSVALIVCAAADVPAAVARLGVVPIDDAADAAMGGGGAETAARVAAEVATVGGLVPDVAAAAAAAAASAAAYTSAGGGGGGGTGAGPMAGTTAGAVPYRQRVLPGVPLLSAAVATPCIAAGAAVSESLFEATAEAAVLAEVAAGGVASMQEAVDFATWTYGYRRITANPSAYRVPGTMTATARVAPPTKAAVSEALSELVEDAVTAAADRGLIVITPASQRSDGDDDSDGGDGSDALRVTPAGAVAVRHAVSPATAAAVWAALPKVRDVVGALELVASAQECHPPVASTATAAAAAAAAAATAPLAALWAVVPHPPEVPGVPTEPSSSSHDDDAATARTWGDGSTSDIPHVGAHITYNPRIRAAVADPTYRAYLLLQAHLCRYRLPPQLLFELKTIILPNVLRVTSLIVDMAVARGNAAAVTAAIAAAQHIFRAVPPGGSPLLQLPHFNGSLVARAVSRGMTSASQIADGDEAVVVDVLSPLSSSERTDVVAAINTIPIVAFQLAVARGTSAADAAKPFLASTRKAPPVTAPGAELAGADPLAVYFSAGAATGGGSSATARRKNADTVVVVGDDARRVSLSLADGRRALSVCLRVSGDFGDDDDEDDAGGSGDGGDGAPRSGGRGVAVAMSDTTVPSAVGADSPSLATFAAAAATAARARARRAERTTVACTHSPPRVAAWWAMLRTTASANGRSVVLAARRFVFDTTTDVVLTVGPNVLRSAVGATVGGVGVEVVVACEYLIDVNVRRAFVLEVTD